MVKHPVFNICLYLRVLYSVSRIIPFHSLRHERGSYGDYELNVAGTRTQKQVGIPNLHDSGFRANRPLWAIPSQLLSYAPAKQHQFGDCQPRCSQLGGNVYRYAFKIEKHEDGCFWVRDASPALRTFSRGTTLLLSIAPPPCGLPVKNSNIPHRWDHQSDSDTTVPRFEYLLDPQPRGRRYSEGCASSYLCRYRPFIGLDRDIVAT
jgi:hypothetical protein